MIPSKREMDQRNHDGEEVSEDDSFKIEQSVE